MPSPHVLHPLANVRVHGRPHVSADAGGHKTRHYGISARKKCNSLAQTVTSLEKIGLTRVTNGLAHA